MREISPALYMTADQYLERRSELKPVAEEIRRQKEAGERAFPSTVLVDKSSMLTKDVREKLLDKVAALVDENVVGRSDMCLQFADLLNCGLVHLKFPSRAVVGIGIYYGPKGDEIWRWRHAWVRVGEELIDGNVDILAENPLVPKAVSVKPYWGPLAEIPSDRRLREDRNDASPEDEDVAKIWWPDLKEWIDHTLLA